MSQRVSLGTDASGTIEETLILEEDRHGKVSGGVAFTFDPQWQLDYNHVQRTDGSDGYTASRDMRKIIELDPGSYLLIAKLNGVRPYSIEHDELVLKLARSSDWKHIKTVEGDIKTRMAD